MTDGDGERAIDFELARSPGNLLRRNHQRSFEIFARIVGGDVTRQQIALLIALGQQPGATQSALVDATGIDKSTLKEMLGRLQLLGWIRRARDPADARAWNVWLTDEGATVMRARMAGVVAAQEEILAPLPPDLRETFLRCLRILIGIDAP